MYSRQVFRVKRIYSEEEDFEQHIHEMRSWFRKKSYHNKILEEELVKLRFYNQKKKSSKKSKGIPFVVTYHPILQALNDIIKRNLN